MSKTRVMIGDIPCWYQTLGPFETVLCGIKNFCPLCGKEVDNASRHILIINNYILFPNVSCHVECAPDGLNEELILEIKEHYDQSKQMMEVAMEKGKPWLSGFDSLMGVSKK